MRAASHLIVICNSENGPKRLVDVEVIRFLVIIAWIAGYCSGCGLGTQEQEPPNIREDTSASRYFCNATVLDFDSPFGPVVTRSGALIAIRGEAISAVLTGDAANRKKAAVQCIDLAGRIVIPGLIDAHAHVTFLKQKQADCRTIDRTVGNYLAAGITTIADLGASDQGQQCLDRSWRNVVLSTGRRLSAESPLCKVPALFFDCPTTENEVAQAIAKRQLAHRSIVKLYTINSRADGIRTALIAKAKAAGVAVIEHETSCRKILSLAQQGRPLPNSLAHPPLDPNCVNQEDIKTLLHSLRVQSVGIISTIQIPLRGRAPKPRLATDFLLLAFKEGVVIGLGSDIDMPGLRQGVPLHDEMILLEEHTTDWVFPLRAATIGSAYVLGQENRIGNLRPGKQADFLILDVRDYADTDRLKKICIVLKAGEIVHQSNSCGVL